MLALKSVSIFVASMLLFTFSIARFLSEDKKLSNLFLSKTICHHHTYFCRVWFWHNEKVGKSSYGRMCVSRLISFFWVLKLKPRSLIWYESEMHSKLNRNPIQAKRSSRTSNRITKQKLNTFYTETERNTWRENGEKNRRKKVHVLLHFYVSTKRNKIIENHLLYWRSLSHIPAAWMNQLNEIVMAVNLWIFMWIMCI